MYWQGVKIIDVGVKGQCGCHTFYSHAIHFNFCKCNKCIAPPTFNHIMYKSSEILLVPTKIKCTCAAVHFFPQKNQYKFRKGIHYI